MNYNILELLSVEDKARTCKISDILNHYNIVQPLVKETNKKDYIALMMQAVAEGTAHTLLDDSCFLYYLEESKYKAKGVCFYGKGNPMGMLVLFVHIFNTPENTIRILKFYPHNDSEIQKYKSLLSVGSIIRWRRYGKPVLIRIDGLYSKISRLLNRFKAK